MYMENGSAALPRNDAMYLRRSEPFPSEWHQASTGQHAFGPSAFLVTRQDSTAVGVDDSCLITSLPSLDLTRPIRARIHFEGGEWIVEAIDIPLYGAGESAEAARSMLKREIESLWDDLNDGSQYGEEWTQVRRFLARMIRQD